MMKQLLITLFIYAPVFLYALLTAPAAHGQVSPFKPGRLRLNLNFDYFTSKANYEPEGGTYFDLENNGSYTASTLDAEIHYESSKKFNMLSGLRFTSAESDNGSYVRSNSQVTDLWVGAQYLAYGKRVQIIPETKVYFPMQKIEANTDNVLLSEGVLQASFGTWLQMKLFDIYTFSYLGGRYRGEGRSHLFDYKLGAFKKWGSLYLGADLLGYISLTDDKYVDNSALRTSINDDVNAGSLHFNGVNPEKLSTDIWAGYKMGKDFLLKLGYQQTLNGKSSSAGSTIMLALEIRNLYNVNQTSIVERKKSERLNEEFEPDTDEDAAKAEEYFLEQEMEIKLEEQTKKVKKNKKRKKKK